MATQIPSVNVRELVENGGTPPDNISACPYGGGLSAVTLHDQAERRLIRVGGYAAAAAGQFELSLQCTPPRLPAPFLVSHYHYRRRCPTALLKPGCRPASYFCNQSEA